MCWGGVKEGRRHENLHVPLLKFIFFFHFQFQSEEEFLDKENRENRKPTTTVRARKGQASKSKLNVVREHFVQVRNVYQRDNIARSFLSSFEPIYGDELLSKNAEMNKPQQILAIL